MSEEHTSFSGQAFLRAYLENNTIDLARMSLGDFRQWYQSVLLSAQRDETFLLQRRIHNLESEHRHALRTLRERWQRALAKLNEWEHKPEYESAYKLYESISAGVKGLSEAVKQGRADPEKLRDFEQRLHLIAKELDDWKSSPIMRSTLSARQSMDELEQAIGLTSLNRQLRQLRSEQGHRSSSGGSLFEEMAYEAVRTRFKNEEILTGVTLGAARAELDLVIVRSGNPHVDVLAIVEAKRNINDLADGFRMRQENLAWLTGSADSELCRLYQNQMYPQGRFDCTAIHREKEREYRFSVDSFAAFQRDHNGWFVNALWYVSRNQGLWGLSGNERGRLMNRIINEGLDAEINDKELRQLRNWLLEIMEPFQTRDLLTLHATDVALANQIVLIQV